MAMRFLSGFQFKSYFALTSFSVLVVLSGTGCQPERREAPAQPCQIGINNRDCGLQVTQSSIWKDQLSITRGEEPNKTETIVSIYYEFTDSYGETKWRRSATVQTDNETPKTMIQSGIVNGISNEKIDLTITDSTCRYTTIDNQRALSFYYERMGDHLHLSQQPIPENKVRNLGDIIVQPLANAIGKGIKKTLQSLFTFGSVKTYLESDDIEMTGGRFLKATERGQLGCFSTFGSGFEPLSDSSKFTR